MPEKEIGKITHHFSKIGVGVIKLTGSLKVGDKIKIVGGNGEFEQMVDSMQVEHAPVTKAKKGDSVGLKVDQPVHEGNKVFLVA
ncbi:MAG: EF-Tu/IF-2/RF-3 family GTPase [Candidatus Peregrinibacteria bacterium]